MQTPPETLADGRYRVLDEIGRGGMSIVYRALDRHLGVERAVKVLGTERADPLARQRLEVEARTMASLAHPGIVTVLDVVHEPPFFCMVMELVEGGPLSAWVAAHGPMPARLALGVLRPVLDAVSAAHRAGVIHRDLKPENILLTAEGRPKVADFGIAHVQDALGQAALTRTGALLGTWGFMAPEQRLDPRAVDPRSDVYALGATIYALVTACAPVDLFAADRDPQILARVPEPCRALIQQATQYRPEDRFADTGALAAAVDALLPHFPTLPADTPPLGGRAAPRPGVTATEESPADTADDLPALTCGEDAGSLPTTATLVPTAARAVRWSRHPVMLAAGALVAVGIAGFAWRVLSDPPSPPPVVTDTPVEAPVLPVVAPEEAVIVAAEIPVPTPMLPVSRRTHARPAESAQLPPPVEPEPVPESAPALATVSAKGDAQAVVLVDASGERHALGVVPAGSYTVEASFLGRADPVVAGRIRLESGQERTLDCQAAFAKCR